MTRNKQIWDADNHYRELGSKFNTFENGAKWADAHPAWKNVNEETPEKNGSYWCFDKSGKQGEMIWMDGSWYGLFDGPVPDETVTHWILLNPPEN